MNEVYIYDVDNQYLSKFRVIHIESGEFGVPDLITVSELVLSNSEKEKEVFIKEAKRSLFEYDIPNTVAANVYELVGSSQTQNNVLDYINNHQTYPQIIGNYTGAVVGMAGKIVGLPIGLHVNFSNGDKASFALTGIGTDGLVLTFAGGIDKDNNSVSITATQVENPGELEFTDLNNDNNLNDFMAAALRYGITVSVTNNSGNIFPGGSSSISSGTFSCSKDVTGKISCTMR